MFHLLFFKFSISRKPPTKPDFSPGLILLFFFAAAYLINADSQAGSRQQQLFNLQKAKGDWELLNESFHTNPDSLPSGAEAQNLYYVDCDMVISGDGASWEQAFKTIQEAITAAVDNDMIWIKKGSYALTTQLVINKSLFIIGGFTGTESNFEERNWSTNETILDGQSQTRCLLITGNVYIEGLTVTNGYVSTPENEGGGVKIINCSPSILHCKFISNVADYNVDNDQPGLGGAMHTTNSLPFIMDCIFEENHGGSKVSEGYSGHGGALYINGGNAALSDCAFNKNYAAGCGGAVYGKAYIFECRFNENESAREGGAVCSPLPSSIIQSSFTKNRTEYYGAAFSGKGTISRCEFSDNIAGAAGAGLYVDEFIIIFNSLFTGNIVLNDHGQNSGGGAIFLTNGTNSFILNSVFSKNLAGPGKAANGGAIYNNGDAKLLNCTFWGNKAFNNNPPVSEYGRGGAIYHSGEYPLALVNSILWGNTGLPAEIETNGSMIELHYCDIDQAGLAGTNNNIRRYPLFVAPLNNNFQLRAGSPCIDAGYNQVAESVLEDLNRANRFIDGNRDGNVIIDMGASEWDPWK